MKVILLGTNGWYSTEMGSTPCIIVDTVDRYVVFDAGEGIYKLDSYIKEDKSIHLFLSHFHLDHIFGLHILGKFRFTQKLTIYGLKGVKKALESVIRHPYSAPISDLPYRCEFVELSEGTYQKPFAFECRQLVHADPCLGYRLELENKSIAYLTDTGVCDNLFELAKNTDLSILECSFKEKQSDAKWPHLSPNEAAEIAKKAKTKKLVLTHFDASVYRTKEDRKNAEKAAKKIFPNTIAGYDGLEIVF